MNLLGTYRATRDPDFTARVIAATVIAANDIVNDTTVPDFHPRRNAAMEVLRVPESHAWVSQFAWRVAANPSVAASVDDQGRANCSDADIQYVVNGAWGEMFPNTPE